MPTFLSVSNVSKFYGAEQVLKNISFMLNDNQRIGLVGANGVGKSTLLKVIVGEVEQDKGEVSIAKDVEIGYLPQAITDYSDKTVDDMLSEWLGNLRELESRLRELELKMGQTDGELLDAILSEYSEITERFERKGGYEIDYKIDLVFEGLQLNHISRERIVSTLSGGEKARMGLAALLIQSPDILLLDEPTNHLDFSMLEWLESYLREYSGAILIVSHDRQFLNSSVSAIVEIDEYSRESRLYSGDYEEYLRRKAQEKEKWEKAYQDQLEEVKELQIALRTKASRVGHNRPAPDRDKITYKFFGERVQQTKSRNIRAIRERLERIEENPIPKPPEPMAIKTDFDPDELVGKLPLLVSGIRKAFDNTRVLENINFSLEVNSRIILVGPNGAGKSTLLRIIMGLEKPDSGEIIVAPSVKIGYLDQEQETLDLEQTVFEVYREGFIGDEDALRGDLLKYGLFSYEDIGKPVGKLSVGQKRKLQIARLIAEKANLLLLDEPTNHISFDVLEEFENALLSFPGAIIAISHDRRFISKFAHQIWVLKNGMLSQDPEDYKSYA